MPPVSGNCQGNCQIVLSYMHKTTAIWITIGCWKGRKTQLFCSNTTVIGFISIGMLGMGGNYGQYTVFFSSPNKNGVVLKIIPVQRAALLCKHKVQQAPLESHLLNCQGTLFLHIYFFNYSVVMLVIKGRWWNIYVFDFTVS